MKSGSLSHVIFYCLTGLPRGRYTCLSNSGMETSMSWSHDGSKVTLGTSCLHPLEKDRLPFKVMVGRERAVTVKIRQRSRSGYSIPPLPSVPGFQQQLLPHHPHLPHTHRHPVIAGHAPHPLPWIIAATEHFLRQSFFWRPWCWKNVRSLRYTWRWNRTRTTQKTPQDTQHRKPFLAHSKYLLRTYCVSGTVLGSRLAIRNRQGGIPPSQHL